MKCRPYVHLPYAAPEAPWSLPALCAAYGLPRNLTNRGPVKISIIELGGASTASDMAIFGRMVGMPMPTIVNPTSPFPADPNGADYEVALDQQIAAFVPWWMTGHPPIIEMLWDKTGTIYSGVASADPKSDVIIICWGAPENEWGVSAAAQMSLAGWNAVGRGTTVCAASGDNDYMDGEPGGAHTDLPASAPSILGVGGTTKTTDSEICWNNGNGEGTGGGLSTFWPRPIWQTTKPVWGWSRAVSDVAANADPNTGYQIVVGGRAVVVGGTSAACPLVASVIASIRAKPGFVTAKCYQNPSAFTRITQGTNGKFPATICAGLGAPNANLVKVLNV